MLHSYTMIYTIVPLGNPGNEYTYTRHNAARIVISLIEEDVMSVEGAELFVPDTFMNESGKAVAHYLKYHSDRELVVVYDDKDLPLGAIRISHDRGDGGHNGVKSIIEHLGTREFVRIRVGIAPIKEDGKADAPHGEAVQGYVMGKFRDEELTQLRAIATNVLASIKDIATLGYQKAMERHN